MPELKYTVIKSKVQYRKYCKLVETLDLSGKDDEETENEIELLVALIKLWDLEHGKAYKLDPVQLLKSFITDHQLKEAQLLKIMEIQSRGHLYDILNYKKGLSRKVIHNLSEYFKVSQEAFNRPYKLKLADDKPVAAVKHVRKKSASKKKSPQLA
jgi:HTH-type transcriptional regulator/antitoxin HigA